MIALTSGQNGTWAGQTPTRLPTTQCIRDIIEGTTQSAAHVHPQSTDRFTSLRCQLILLLVLTTPAVCSSQPVNAFALLPTNHISTSVNTIPLSNERPRSNRWKLEVAGVFFREAWDLNRQRERPVGGVILFARSLKPNWAIGVETTLLHVSQKPGPNIFLPAWSLMLRRDLFRFGIFSVFAEGSGGLSYASDRVPARGTQFNLVSQLGMGLLGRISPRGRLVTSVRWLHLSNNGLNGSSRNPDIQAVGLYLGWRLP